MYPENSIMKEGVKWKEASRPELKASLFLDERTAPIRPG
jgi:hypothetical protein